MEKSAREAMPPKDVVVLFDGTVRFVHQLSNTSSKLEVLNNSSIFLPGHRLIL